MTDWRVGEFPFLCLLLAGSGTAFIFLIVEQIRELVFYRKNGWDFSQDSNIPLGNYYWGEDSLPEYIMSNKDRILLGRPIGILLAAIFSLVFTSIIFDPEQWTRGDGSAEPGRQPIVGTHPNGD